MRQIIVIEGTGLKYKQPCVIYKLHDIPLETLAIAYPAIDKSRTVANFYQDDSYLTGTLFILFYFDPVGGYPRRRLHAASGEISDKFAMLVISGLMSSIALPEQTNIHAVADIPLMSEASFLKAVKGAEAQGVDGLWRVFV